MGWEEGGRGGCELRAGGASVPAPTEGVFSFFLYIKDVVR